MRGVVALEVLRQLEAVTGRRIHQIFDFICGVSTGAIIASFLGFHKKTIDEIEEIYKRLGQEIFPRNLIKGTTGWITSVNPISKIQIPFIVAWCNFLVCFFSARFLRLQKL